MIRTPDQRLRVFVSSTLKELAAERAAVRKAIESLRLTPVLFELGARPHPPRELYRSYLEQSDVFVGIYGDSYGWIAPDMDISGLEDEFRLGGRLPRLLYVKQPAPERDRRLEALLAQVVDDGDVTFKVFGDADELGSLVEDDLALLLSERFAARPRASRATVPAPFDLFVGRTAELAELERLLIDGGCRLVTVTGPGGVGKTRLALEAAGRVSDGFSDGAHFVALDSIADPGLVAGTIHESLETPQGALAPLEALVEQLREARLLLVLDNFEHVLAAAPDVERLLQACPGLTVLVTSRSVLRLRGERELRVDPLEQPDAVALFVDRARAANRSFDPGDAVAEICRRLDGIPLAVELAAAQTRVLPPAAILERLAGPTSVQRTLEAAIEWSFGLLSEGEQALCTQAGVFRGGFTLEALEAVAADEATTLERLAALVEGSLVRPDADGGEARYSMLETIRAYAVQRLEDRDAVLERHAAFFVEFADEAGQSLRRPRHEETLLALDRESGNLRAALEWLLERGDAARITEAVWALLPYWTLRERVDEARAWLAEARQSRSLSDGARAKSLVTEGMLALWFSDFGAAGPLLAEGLALEQSVGDEATRAMGELGLGTLGVMRGDETGFPRLERSLSSLERLEDEWGAALATVAVAWGFNAAESDAPIDLYENALARASDLGFETETLALGALGRRRALRGEEAEAKRLLAEALERTTALRVGAGIALNLDLLADLAAVAGQHRLAASLSAAAEAHAESVETVMPALAGDRAARLSGLREQLGDDAFEAARSAGRALTIEEATAQALAFARGDEEN